MYKVNTKGICLDHITQDQVKRFWNLYQKKYNTKVKLKKKSFLMRTVGSIFERAKICTKKEFLTEVTTTIGRTIFKNKPIALSTKRSVLLDDIELAIHEHFHVRNKVGYKYITSKNYRAKEEARVYIATQLIFSVLCRLEYNQINEKDFAYSCAFNTQLYVTSKYDTNYTRTKAKLAARLYNETGCTNELYVVEALDMLRKVF